jgi:hypothetical protein
MKVGPDQRYKQGVKDIVKELKENFLPFLHV